MSTKTAVRQQIIDTIDTLPFSAVEEICHYVLYRKAQFEKNFEETSREKKSEHFRNAIKNKNIPVITLPADENGNAYIDKERYPELYDWAVNG
jgi:hypothetical protein